MFGKKRDNLYLVNVNYDSAKCIMELAPDTWRFLQDSGMLLSLMNVSSYSLSEATKERILGRKPEDDDDSSRASEMIDSLAKSEVLALYPECVSLSGPIVIPEKIAIKSEFMMSKIKQIIKV